MLSETLVDKIVEDYTKDKILYNAFLNYFRELNLELQAKPAFIDMSPRVLEGLICIDKLENNVFIYKMKIMNREMEFEINQLYDQEIIENVYDITKENASEIVVRYIKNVFC